MPPSSLSPSPPPFDSARFRELAGRAVDIVVEHLGGVRERPVFSPVPAERRRTLREQPLPDAGCEPGAILDFFAREILPHPMGNGHPRFFGWVNSPPSPLGILADFLAAAMDPSCAGGDHAAVYLEHCAVRWLMELLGFLTAGSKGILVSGGSMASLTCLAAARHWAAKRDGWNVREEGLQGGRPRLVLYRTEEGHSCLRKAAELLGLGEAGQRVVAVDDRFALDVPSLRRAIAADRAAGLRPFCVAASAGTVNTGAIDPLAEIADVCAGEGLWLHVDGAYGAPGVLHRELAPRYAGMERADSLAVDPHKWLSVPVECGCALLRDAANLRDAFSLVPSYLRTEEGKGFGGPPWFSEFGFQQTRGFRALKLWMTLLAAGRQGLTRTIERHVALARRLGELVDADRDLERLAPVELSVVCFRYAPPDRRSDAARLDALNKAIVERVQSEGEAFLSSTLLRGRFALRACVLHHATDATDVEDLLAVVRKAGASVAAEQLWAP